MPKWNRGDVEREFARRTAGIQAAILLKLAYVGEQCVSQARSLNTYRDQTGNLRSSIGYVIARNGAVLKSDFSGSAAGGESIGMAYARSLIGDAEPGYVLIVVAGMNYALAVESRGLDVLSSAEQLGKTLLPGLLRDIKNQTAT